MNSAQSITATSPNRSLSLFQPEADALIESGRPTLSKELVESFAAATGWEIARVGDELVIVDMDAKWPAKKPTAHRGHCDRFVEAMSKLLNSVD